MTGSLFVNTWAGGPPQVGVGRFGVVQFVALWMPSTLFPFEMNDACPSDAWNVLVRAHCKLIE